jgi:hypothetical protein
MKECKTCKEIKELDSFTKDKLSKGGYKQSCKLCIAKACRERRVSNPKARREYEAKWRAKNVDKCKSGTYKWREKNPEQWSNYRKKYYQNNKEKIAEQSKATYEKYKQKYNENNRRYQKDNHKLLMQKRKERIESNPLLQFKERIRCLVKNSFYRLKHNKTKRVSEVIGADWEIVKEHFVSQFKDGMTWEAFIAGEIHVDHIQPLASAKTEEELIALCHYTNLQPLWCLDNLSKGAIFEGVNYKTKQ